MSVGVPVKIASASVDWPPLILSHPPAWMQKAFSRMSGLSYRGDTWRHVATRCDTLRHVATRTRCDMLRQ